MTDKELDKALDIVSVLITGGEVSKNVNATLYDEFENNGEVYNIVLKVLKKLNINI